MLCYNYTFFILLLCYAIKESIEHCTLYYVIIILRSYCCFAIAMLCYCYAVAMLCYAVAMLCCCYAVAMLLLRIQESIEHRILLIDRFIQARRLVERDPESTVQICEGLLKERSNSATCHCSAPFCTALHCTVLLCTIALHCTALYCTVLLCTILYCSAL